MTVDERDRALGGLTIRGVAKNLVGFGERPDHEIEAGGKDALTLIRWTGIIRASYDLPRGVSRSSALPYFRDLVKDLAREYQTRIEMRQIGVRDEAKLLADYGDCGKPVCCNTHMTQMPPVSMRMAKLQKSTLDPSKISGRCGRLKCCLRFEQDVYEEFQAELPPPGETIMPFGAVCFGIPRR